MVDQTNARGPESSPRIIAIANQKGGVGKTTTAINLATAMAAAGNRVLIVDLDPQGNASTGLGIERSDRKVNAYHVLIGEAPIAVALQHTAVPGLDLIPSGIDLSGAEIELVDAERREQRLRDALRVEHAKGYDYVLIDCPPALNLLTVNALVSADAVMVPLQCEFFALEGISLLVRTIDLVRKHYNQKLQLQGIVLTMFDKRNNLSDMVAADVRGHFGDKVYNTVIPRNVRISEAPSFGKPVLLYDVKCAGSEAYIHLCSEVLRRERELRA